MYAKVRIRKAYGKNFSSKKSNIKNLVTIENPCRKTPTEKNLRLISAVIKISQHKSKQLKIKRAKSSMSGNPVAKNQTSENLSLKNLAVKNLLQKIRLYQPLRQKY